MIYHILTPNSWEQALDREVYEHPSLLAEGFIHCSTRAQVLATARLHFAQEQELVVLHIVERRVKPILKFEPSRNGELFPHLYGKLEFAAIEDLSLLVRDDEGRWVWDLGRELITDPEAVDKGVLTDASPELQQPEPEPEV